MTRAHGGRVKARSEANDRAPARGPGLYPAEYAGILRSPETSCLPATRAPPSSTIRALPTQHAGTARYPSTPSPIPYR
jgi:hypothetical protein